MELFLAPRSDFMSGTKCLIGFLFSCYSSRGRRTEAHGTKNWWARNPTAMTNSPASQRTFVGPFLPAILAYFIVRDMARLQKLITV